MKHWMQDVVQRARLEGCENLSIDSETPTDRAWALAQEAAHISDTQLAKLVAAHFLLNLADISKAEKRAFRLVPAAVAEKYQVFPLTDHYGQIVVATSDPTDIEIEHALGFASGRTPLFEIAPPLVLKEAIYSHYSPDRAVESLLSGVGAEHDDSVSLVEDEGPEAVLVQDLEAGPVVKLTNLILRDATVRGASDIHVEPGRGGGIVRLRIDGVLQHYMKMPTPALNRVVSRIKILGNLDISDRLRPQDGKARVRVGGATYDLRISTVPIREAEKAVVRILDSASTGGLEEVGMHSYEHARVRHILSHREGIMVVTGPTGSGKTTTLYAALQEVSTGHVNVMTVEDPIEYELPGVNQIQIEPKRGVTFASALRAILRQDPDVLLVGEIRDEETASVAIQASMTGHLVLATLHTNDAIGAVNRLVDLGLDRAAVAESIKGAIAQRLVRKVCECAEPVGDTLTDREKQLAKNYDVTPLVRSVGCDKCGEIGYRGRIPILEVVTSDDNLAQLISQGATTTELHRAAIEGGMRPLRQVGAELVSEGKTTLQELERVLGDVVAEEDLATKPQKILVVDDDATNRTLARILLEKGGFEVSEAADGLAALEVLNDGSEHALMVLDLDMPRLGGMEVLARLRSTVATAAMPVVVLTNSDDPDSEIKAMDEGADDYIRKPIDPPRFLVRVKAALRRSAA